MATMFPIWDEMLELSIHTADIARTLKKNPGAMFLRRSGSHSASPRGSIFSNFETVQLSTEERLFLHAAKMGDVGMLKELLDNQDKRHYKLKINCVDYMGRTALFLAVDTENVEAIEILLERINWECIDEALLHAISKGNRNLVRIIVDHPAYLAGEKQARLTGKRDGFFRTEEKYQYPPEITPLILAAHKNDHELVQLFLSRGCTIERPHAICCSCENCQVKQESDSLKRSRSRLNAYRALASPAYMALSSPDPITTTFELRQEMKQVAHVEKEFTNEYLSLVEQCMDFACELMDLCRGTQEVEAILGEENGGTRDPLARLRLGIQYDEKKFVAHPNCQQHLTSIWYGKQMKFMQPLSLSRKVALILGTIPLLPFLCLAYIVTPHSKISKALRCPVTKFMSHTTSHFTFLFLLALATFGLEEIFYGLENIEHMAQSGDLDLANVTELYIQSNLRPMRKMITHVQILLVFWIIGLLWIECKQIYSSGAEEHFRQYYNFMDWSLLGLYLASYALRFVAQFRVLQADRHFNASARAMEALERKNLSLFMDILEESKNPKHYPYGYFIPASRFEWSPADPEIVSDILFAIANVMSFARTTYVMPSHEMLGPLQISLGRMLGDITRFVVLFLLVLLAFMVGMTNLYRYYGSHISKATSQAASETFKGLPETVHTLFFSIFGLIPLSSLKIRLPGSHPLSTEDPQQGAGGLQYEFDNWGPRDEDTSTSLVDRVGLVMFAIYTVAVSIVLVNILIAMMSHSFEVIQGDNDMEWKFARTKLWMNYIDEGGTLPVPFNMIPTPKSIVYAVGFVKRYFYDQEEEQLKDIGYNFKRRRENTFLPDPEVINSLIQRRSTYSDIMQRLIRRYLFKLERSKIEDGERSPGRVEDYSEGGDGEVDGEDGPGSPLEDLTAEQEEQDQEEEERLRQEENALRTIREQDSTEKEPFGSPCGPLSPGLLQDPEFGPSSPPIHALPPAFVPPVNFVPAPEIPTLKRTLSPTRVEPTQRRYSHGAHVTIQDPTAAITRSKSAETLHRQITRRATLRRTGTQRGSRKTQQAPNAQLDAIQRGQRVLDARLQDLQTSHTEETIVRENLAHMRRAFEEQQRAMGSMVKAMESMQDEMHILSQALSCRRTPSNSSKGKEGKNGKLAGIKKSLRRRRSDRSEPPSSV